MPDALFFDVFGTVVDWRTGVAREARSILQPLGHALDWLRFADAWRARYQPAMAEVRDGRMPFARLDVLHRRMLESILGDFGLAKLDEATLATLTLAWHRLDAWEDASALALGRCMMVAAHSSDLAAAKAVGLQTAHVARPGEAPGMKAGPTVPVDIAARSFDELADKLGA